jgi:uncharacterized repeat protein (TIGR01451 family)
LAAIAIGVIGAVAQAADPGDLKITKSDNADPVSKGDTLIYTIVVENLGSDPVPLVTVEDKLPGGLNYLSSSTTAGTCTQQAKTVTCNLGTLAGLADETVTIRTRVTKNKGHIDNTATVDSKDGLIDPVPANNTDTERTTVKVPPSGPTCQGAAATIVGTNGPNVINGTGHRDVILAGAGDDQVFAGGGSDIVCAGPGFDLVGGGPKGDSIKGGLNGDRLRGGGGNDALRGNRGPDRLRGGFGDDLLAGGLGADNCRGGPGADILRSC